LSVPPGDVLVPIEWAIRKLSRLSAPSFVIPWPRGVAMHAAFGGLEQALRSWGFVGAALLALLGLFAILLAFG
jgi:hypothetical protein